MKSAELYSDSGYRLGHAGDSLYSSFIEHLGRAVYTGIYEPGHPDADSEGFREDVISTIQDLAVSMVRYPGGNFVSCYNWKDGIGPKDQRPTRMDYAWASVETNQFGIDEFCRWATKTGIEPMIAVNLGTGSIQDAGDLVEYCNHPGGTHWSDLRDQNGSPEPYGVKYWCLGNEMEGSWQAGHLSAEAYAEKALEAAKIMRWVDPSIKLIACGSSYEMLPTYLEWDRVVLQKLYDHVDYLSTHNYTMTVDKSVPDALASYKQLDDHIKNTASAIRYMKAMLHKKKDIKICLDEWNVWNFQDIKIDSLDDLSELTTFEMTSADKWEIAPPILQEKYSLLDALTLGGLGITLLNNSDTVEIACLAQLINVIAPITTAPNGKILKQTIYHPFDMVSSYGRGDVMRVMLDGDTYSSCYGQLPVVEAAVVYNREKDEIRVFALNCSQDEATEFAMTFNGYGDRKVSRHVVLSGDDLAAQNTWENPNNVGAKEVDVPVGGTSVVLPAASWNLMVLSH